MLARAAAIRCCLAVLLPGSPYAQQTRPREHFQNADVIYDWVSNSRGDKLRTFISPPRNASGKVPFLSFVGWLSCDSVESPQGETDSLGALVLGLIDRLRHGADRKAGGWRTTLPAMTFQAEVITMILNWAKEQLATGKSSGALQPGPRSLLGSRGLAGFE